MPHLTRVEIERRLARGVPIGWLDAAAKKVSLTLSDAKERRLFEFILASGTRSPMGLAPSFIEGLQAAYDAQHDPASTVPESAEGVATSGPWRLQSIETMGFGGINSWNGQPFKYEIDGQSLLLEGPNGSGKSSLAGAIIWALTGERFRDQSSASAHELKPVLGVADQALGHWPPLATYPPSATDLQSVAHVRVTLTFSDANGTLAKVERTLSGTKINETIDPSFVVPPVLVEAGMLMPARLSTLRFDDGRGRLIDAVQKLTGLDELIELSLLVEGLCHKAREYRSYKKRELRQAQERFDAEIAEARSELAPVSIKVSEFLPKETQDTDGALAHLQRMLEEKSTALTEVITSDIATDLDLSNPGAQNQVVAAIAGAKDDINEGLAAVSVWERLELISSVIDAGLSARLQSAVQRATNLAQDALNGRNQANADSKFYLKATASSWHQQHKSGAIENCPLCEMTLRADSDLAKELESLRSASIATTRAFDDGVNRAMATLDAELPSALRTISMEQAAGKPRSDLLTAIRAQFVTKERYSKTLVSFSKTVEAAFATSPDLESQPIAPGLGAEFGALPERIAYVLNLIRLAEWHREHVQAWRQWWHTLSGTLDANEAPASMLGQTVVETLTAHLNRLSNALDSAGPYRRAANHLKEAWNAGKEAAEIQDELNRRDAIAESLTPLKNLKALCESVARETIGNLSSSISDLVNQIYLTESLHFSDAQLDRKEGLVVHGGFSPELRIDATLVANTSWLRAVLWSFIFSLRAEAIKQLGNDPLPLLVFDDPQATFDSQHRHRWAEYVASLQGASKAQVVLATHDETFLHLIKVDGVSGREALIVGAGPPSGRMEILEGAGLDRDWDRAQKEKTPKAARDYMVAARIYIEGMLKLMLVGENVPSNTSVMGGCREKIRILNEVNGGVAPWDRTEFRNLITHLEKTRSTTKHLEIVHHSNGAHLGMAEATDLHAHLEKHLLPTLQACFRMVREHRTIHGARRALHSPSPSIQLPHGYRDNVKQIPLRVLGRAAALSDGRIADGRVDLDEFATTSHKKITLAQHVAYRLVSRTLEPVARPGDVLIVHESSEPSSNSLVVARHESRILARRYELADGLSDVAVLIAQATNPHRISPPLVAARGTLTAQKIVGVLYANSGKTFVDKSDSEVCDCGGESAFATLTSSALGLVEVVGHSAEPQALDGQHLIVGTEISNLKALNALDGRPVIAADTEGNRYFKRLRIGLSERVVLESLDSAEEFGPIVLFPPGSDGNCLAHVWPVVGVLFELPS